MSETQYIFQNMTIDTLKDMLKYDNMCVGKNYDKTYEEHVKIDSKALEKKKVMELKKLAEIFGENKNGNKTELIERIQVVDLSKKTLVDLKKVAEVVGVTKSGNKSQLLKKIIDGFSKAKSEIKSIISTKNTYDNTKKLKNNPSTQSTQSIKNTENVGNIENNKNNKDIINNENISEIKKCEIKSATNNTLKLDNNDNIINFVVNENNNNNKNNKNIKKYEGLTKSDLEHKTLTELKNLADAIGATKSGNKDFLIEKLLNNLQDRKHLAGFVYVLNIKDSNKVKIGNTKKRKSIDKVNEYLRRRYHTSLGTNIDIYIFKTNKRVADEKLIHEFLDKYRESGTELFKINIEKALKVSNDIIQKSPIKLN